MHLCLMLPVQNFTARKREKIPLLWHGKIWTKLQEMQIAGRRTIFLSNFVPLVAMVMTHHFLMKQNIIPISLKNYQKWSTDVGWPSALWMAGGTDPKETNQKRFIIL